MGWKKILFWTGGIIVGIILILSLIPKTPNDIIPSGNYTVDYTNLKQRGDRLLGVDVNQGKDVDYNTAISIAKNAGMQVSQLSLAWNDIEKSKETYGNENLGIANSYYPAQNLKVALVITPIDTNVNRLPDDLKNKKLDDEEVINRFNKMIDYVFAQIPNLDLASLSIGNEIDSYLGNDNEKWTQYTNFYQKVAEHIKTKKPNLKIGTKATFKGFTQNNIQQLTTINQYSDVILVTYYPIKSDFSVEKLSVVREDFDRLVSFYNKEIQFLEAGAPSSSILDSSEDIQAKMIGEIFHAWDAHKDKIKLINFVWLYDRSKSELDNFAKYYGFSDKRFIAYLGSLGLITYEGKNKLGITALEKEAKARGW